MNGLRKKQNGKKIKMFKQGIAITEKSQKKTKRDR